MLPGPAGLLLNFFTVLVLRMAHRKWKETKQQPSKLPVPAVPGCCLVYFHILWAILSTSTVLVSNTYCFHGPGRASSPRADFGGQNPSFCTSGFSVLSVLVYMTIFPSFKMTHIEVKSIHIWLRYDQKWEILIL